MSMSQLISCMADWQEAGLQETKAVTVQDKLKVAMKRMETVALDRYDNISSLSLHWISDETGGNQDSALFSETISALGNVEVHIRPLLDEEIVSVLHAEVISLASALRGERRLFILHYAGHAIASAPSNSLHITSRIGKNEVKGPQMDMTYIRDGLMHLAKDLEGLDILIVLDCCCAAIAGRGQLGRGRRVELIAATSAGGLSNSREDHPELTFTQRWCDAFKYCLKFGHPFTCEDLRSRVNQDADLEQFPAMYILREGWRAPITFRALAAASAPTVGPPVQTVITALHIVENHRSTSMDDLLAFLEKAPCGIEVIATLPVASTLLLLRVPQILQELLELPQIVLIVLPPDA